MRYPIGGPASVVTSLPKGRDFFRSHVFADTDGDHVYYDPGPCKSEQSDVFQVIVP